MAGRLDWGGGRGVFSRTLSLFDPVLKEDLLGSQLCLSGPNLDACREGHSGHGSAPNPSYPNLLISPRDPEK